MLTVPDSAELRRIAALPRRSWTRSELQRLADALTARYRAPGGTWNLLLNQARFCAEVRQCNGGFFAYPVGAGKTIMAAAAPEILDSTRALILVPAALREKTYHDFAEIRRHFTFRKWGVSIMSHEVVQHPNSRRILHESKPDLIVVDESQAFKNTDATRTKRFLEFFAERPDCRLVVLTGSPTDTSLMEYWHQMVLALKDNAPVPYVRRRAEEIADALDSEVKYRREPGALLTLCTDETGTPLTRARQAVRKRMQDTWGVVIDTQSSCDQPITLHLRADIEIPDALANVMNAARTTSETPNGDVLENALEVAAHVRQLASGFFYLWDPPPPPKWLSARRAWRRFVRETLEASNGLHDPDAPSLVARANPDHPLLRQWLAVKDVYDPDDHRRAQWLSDYMLEAAVALADNRPALVWLDYREVGARLAKHTGWEYLGGGPDASARLQEISRGRWAGKQSLILSRAAHSKGNNLQAWTHNVMLTHPSKPGAWEQAIGRSHRQGQTHPITVAVPAHIDELKDSVQSALRHAAYVYETTGQPQKLLLAKRKWKHKKKLKG